MALRSLGSTLLAKAGVGSQLRSAEEERKQGAVQSQNEGAQPTSASRELIQQPLETKTPEGTEKKVASQPSIQEKVSLSGDKSTDLLPGAVGLATPGVKTPAATASVGRTPAPVGQPSPNATAAPTPTTGGANLQTQIKNLANAGILPQSEITAAARKGSVISAPTKATTAPQQKPAPFDIGSLGALGNRVSAAGDQAGEFSRNLLQGIAATIESLINKAGEATGNVAPEMNISERLGIMANNPNSQAGIAQNLNKVERAVRGATQGTGSPTRAVASAAKQIVSNPKAAASTIKETFKPANTQAMASNLQAAGTSALNKLGSLLRSLFR